MLSRMIVSQNSTPGSADFHALWMIFSQSFRASMSCSYLGLSDLIGNCWWYFFPARAARMKSSSILIETLAPVTLPVSTLASMNRSASGCLIDSDSISAPRRPSCATSRVEFE